MEVHISVGQRRVLRDGLNFLGCREGYCTETVITPYINTGRDQCTKSRAALSEDSEPCTGAMSLQCALCSRELKKRVERTLHASSFPDKAQLVYICCNIPCKSLQKPSYINTVGYLCEQFGGTNLGFPVILK